MVAPPGYMPGPQTSGETSAAAESPTQQRIEAALRLSDVWNIGWSRSKVLRLIRRYEYEVEPNDHSLFDFLVNAAKLTEYQRREAYRVAINDPDNQILFRDPVGEKAVQNVLRQRGY